MRSKSKPVIVGSAARKRAAKPPRGRARRVGRITEARVQTAQAPEERDDDIACERIVILPGDGRSPPLYYDEYN